MGLEPLNVNMFIMETPSKSTVVMGKSNQILEFVKWALGIFEQMNALRHRKPIKKSVENPWVKISVKKRTTRGNFLPLLSHWEKISVKTKKEKNVGGKYGARNQTDRISHGGRDLSQNMAWGSAMASARPETAGDGTGHGIQRRGCVRCIVPKTSRLDARSNVRVFVRDFSAFGVLLKCFWWKTMVKKNAPQCESSLTASKKPPDKGTNSLFFRIPTTASRFNIHPWNQTNLYSRGYVYYLSSIIYSTSFYHHPLSSIRQSSCHHNGTLSYCHKHHHLFEIKNCTIPHNM